MPEGCPSCEREFDSSRALRVHHAGSHDRRLPNRTCADCGTEFYREYEVKYCSEACRNRSVSFGGRNNPNYRGAKRSTRCDNCQAVFEYYPSEKEGCYCPDCVQNGGWRHRPDVAGENNPRYTGGLRRTDCDVCGATVERYPSELEGGSVVCSRRCRSVRLSTLFSGAGHPNWKGGPVGSYGRGWSAARSAALDRDGHACIRCGTDRDAIGREPDVHHIVPVRKFADHPTTTVSDAHAIENLVSLCPACHQSIERHTPERRHLVWFQYVVGKE